MTHDADKLIRQLSLVAYLMAEQRPVTARDVKNNVEGYANMGDEAFARRYYADRAELQGLGVPITSGRDEFTGEELYTLREEQYFLPPIDLNDQELAALLNCLGMLDGQFAYAEPLRLALQNLALGRHVSADPGSDSVRVNLLGSVYTPEIAQRLAKLELAISKQRTVRFSYRSLGGGERRERQINPYGLFELNSVWYVIGDDLEVPEEEPRRKTYRVSRMGSEIKFATRRERDFRIPADFDVNAYRDRLSWQLGDETEGEAVLWIAPDSTFVARRLYGRRSEITEHEDGSATLVTEYTDLEPLSQLVLQHLGQVRPVEPPELARMVEKDLKRIVRLHKGRPSHATPEPRPEHSAPQSSARAQGPVAPERFALLQALLAFLLERCGDETSATVSSADIRERFRLTQDELEEHLDLLNLVNFGGGCYAVYCATDNGSVHVDKELYGDTFRRPARLSPLEAKALIRALDVVAPLIAAEAHTTLASVRDKVQASFGDYSLRDTPSPAPSLDEESTVTVLNQAVRDKLVTRIRYLSRSSGEYSERAIEPHLLHRDETGWYVEAWDLSKEARRTFKVQYVERAEIIGQRFEPRLEMQDLTNGLDSEAGTARILYTGHTAELELERPTSIEPAAEGGAVATVPYGSVRWLLSKVLSHRGQAEVLGPDWLREAVRDQAESLLTTAEPEPARG